MPVRQPLRELSLFTGGGGGLYGSLLTGHEIIGAVEYEEYCCRILEQRQKDGVFKPFPIFQTDIRDFIRHGYADLYQRRCDLISAGFPCTPFSAAGKRQGESDPRNLWPETLDAISRIRPRYALLENVPGLITSGYFGTILGNLSEIGYDASWEIISAAEVGAPHIRKRLWILAHPSRELSHGSGEPGQRRRGQFANGGGEMANPDSVPALGASITREKCNPWPVEPEVGRISNGVANRSNQLRALGNGQVPRVFATAWRRLTQE